MVCKLTAWKTVMKNKLRKERVSVHCSSSSSTACSIELNINSLSTGYFKGVKFSDDFDLLDSILGKGRFSYVNLGLSKDDNTHYAIKVIRKKQLSYSEKRLVKNEAKILQSLDHTNILKLYAVYKEKDKYYFVEEYMAGGTLYDRIIAKNNYTEIEARDTARILFDAMSYCHSHLIAHRDLKPENLLLISKDNHVNIKVGDFGFAKHVPDSGLKTGCGSPLYIAPEILSRKPYGVQVDSWSAGVVIYILLSGCLPFVDSDVKLLDAKICKAEFDFSDEIWENVSAEAKDLITKMLVPNPKKRLSTKQALSHTWFNHDVKSELQKHKLNVSDTTSGTEKTTSTFYSRSSLKNSFKIANEYLNKQDWSEDSDSSITSISSTTSDNSIMSNDELHNKFRAATNSVIFLNTMSRRNSSLKSVKVEGMVNS